MEGLYSVVFPSLTVGICCFIFILSCFPGAKPAPGICFERVNSAGDPYGNCGKDSKGSFAKCQARYSRGMILQHFAL